MADSTMRIIIQAVDKATGTFKNIGNQAQGMAGKIKTAGDGLALVSKVVAGITAVAIAAKKYWDFSEQGAQVSRLEIATTKLAKSYGANMMTITSAIQRASLNTISQFDAMQSAGRAMMLGLGSDSSQLANLMEIAAFRGKVMGVNTTQAFNDIVTGIGRKSRLILDNLGIIIDAESAYEKYAASIGVAADELDAAGQTQAYMNAVLEEGNRLMEQAGGLTADAATGYDRVKRAVKDATDEMKMDSGRALGALFLTPGERRQAFQEEMQLIQLQANSYNELRRIALGVAADYGLQGEYQNFMPSEFAFNEARYFEQLAAAYASIPAKSDGVTSSILAANKAIDLQVGLASGVTDIMEKYDNAVLKAGNGTVKLNAANEDLADSLAELTFELATLEGAMDTDATFNLAVHLGLIDQKSVAWQQTLSALTKAFDANGDGILQATEQTEAYWAALGIAAGNADALVQDRDAKWTITVTMNGVSLTPGQALAAGLIPSSSAGGASSYMMGNGGFVNLSVPGGAHGLDMTVPPGYPGDSFPVLASSGERVTITPRGGSTAGGSNTFKFYGNPTFVLGEGGMSASDLMRQMGV